MIRVFIVPIIAATLLTQLDRFLQAAKVKDKEEDAYADAIEFHGHGEHCTGEKG